MRHFISVQLPEFEFPVRPPTAMPMCSPRWCIQAAHDQAAHALTRGLHGPGHISRADLSVAVSSTRLGCTAHGARGSPFGAFGE